MMNFRRIVSALASSAMLWSVTVAQDGDSPPIKSLEDIPPRATLFEDSGLERPLMLRSPKEAAGHFSEEELEKLRSAVDFSEQLVLVFAWRGSDQDRLEFQVLESYPEQVVFSLVSGKTTDLRPHVRIFAMRSNVKWTWKRDDAVAPATEPDEYIKVKVKGKLNSQVLAIGGETTGVIISAGGVTWELDLGRNEELRKKADELHEQMAIVRGTLRLQEGVEIRERWIVEVESLTAPGMAADAGDDDASDYLNADGTLRSALIMRDSQTGFAGESGHIWTIDPDGSWRHQTFLNEMIRKPEHEGKFTKRQLRALAGHLARYDLVGLPERLGKPPEVNPHVYAISFGRKQVALIGPGGASLPPVDAHRLDAPEQRFAALMRVLQQELDIEPADKD